MVPMSSLLVLAAVAGGAFADGPAAVGSIPTVPIAPGISLPMAGLGTWLYNDTVAEAAVALALSIGYTHIDTAHVYGNHVGIGRAIAASNRARDTFFLTDKVPGGLNQSATLDTMEAGLKELQVEYVDLMLVHFPASMDAAASGGPEGRVETWKALEAFVKAGKAKAIGVSHYCQHHLEDIAKVATLPISVNQVQYHVGMGTAAANATDDKAFFNNVGTLYQSFSPLCGPCETKELVDGPLVTRIGAAHNKSGAQVSLKWLVQQGVPVIPKTSNEAHMRENVDLFGWELTPAEMLELTLATSPPVAGDAGPPITSGDCPIA